MFGALAAAALVAAASRADAHLGNISYADFTVRGTDVILDFRYAAHVSPGIPPAATSLTRAELLSHEKEIEDWLAATTSVDTGERRCTFALENITGPDRDQNLDVVGGWSCNGEIKALRIDFHPLETRLADWQTIATIHFGERDYSTVFTPGSTRWQIGDLAAALAPPDAPPDAPGSAAPGSTASAGAKAAPSAATPDAGTSIGNTAFGRFFVLGVWHIWTGYDHLLFLLAVLLAGGGIARLAGIVTSFTLAHSITLGAAATGLVRLPVAPVEAAIALSIVFVATENLLGRGADRRALVTFFFGLIHGFGFASVLAEASLPAGGIVVPLLAFNLGVEAGQLAVVLAVVPLLALALRSRYAREVNVGLSSLIAIAGAVWAIERIVAIVR